MLGTERDRLEAIISSHGRLVSWERPEQWVRRREGLSWLEEEYWLDGSTILTGRLVGESILLGRRLGHNLDADAVQLSSIRRSRRDRRWDIDIDWRTRIEYVEPFRSGFPRSRTRNKRG